jgi:hypothetical protein
MKYHIAIAAKITLVTKVEAGSVAEALDIAKGRDVVSLCWQCAGGDEDTQWCTTGELDTTADGSELVEVSDETTGIIGYIDEALRATWRGL